MSGTQPQKSLGSFKLRTLFQEKTAAETHELETDGTASILRHLSLGVHELQEAGIDVRIDNFSWFNWSTFQCNSSEQ